MMMGGSAPEGTTPNVVAITILTHSIRCTYMQSFCFRCRSRPPDVLAIAEHATPSSRKGERALCSRPAAALTCSLAVARRKVTKQKEDVLEGKGLLQAASSVNLARYYQKSACESQIPCELYWVTNTQKKEMFKGYPLEVQ